MKKYIILALTITSTACLLGSEKSTKTTPKTRTLIIPHAASFAIHSENGCCFKRGFGIQNKCLKNCQHLALHPKDLTFRPTIYFFNQNNDAIKAFDLRPLPLAALQEWAKKRLDPKALPQATTYDFTDPSDSYKRRFITFFDKDGNHLAKRECNEGKIHFILDNVGAYISFDATMKQSLVKLHADEMQVLHLMNEEERAQQKREAQELALVQENQQLMSVLNVLGVIPEEDVKNLEPQPAQSTRAGLLSKIRCCLPGNRKDN